jgi:hypothetical protein
MKTFWITTALLVALAAPASARTYHYACHQHKDATVRYALSANEDSGIVKLQEQGPPFTLRTFQIVKNVIPACGKGGWTLSNGATKFCTATQGVGDLSWRGPDLDCDQADTE